jgi:hypothetical protein
MTKGRLSRLFRILRLRQTAQARAEQGPHDNLPFPQDEFAALIRSRHPMAMKTLADGLAKRTDIRRSN